MPSFLPLDSAIVNHLGQDRTVSPALDIDLRKAACTILGESYPLRNDADWRLVKKRLDYLILSGAVVYTNGVWSRVRDYNAPQV